MRSTQRGTWMSHGPPCRQWLLQHALKRECRLLPYATNRLSRHTSICIHACACVLALCSVFLRGLFLSVSWLSALWEKQMTNQLVLNQHSSGLSEARRGAIVKSSPHTVTLLVCHQSHTFTQRPLGLSEKPCCPYPVEL